MARFFTILFIFFIMCAVYGIKDEIKLIREAVEKIAKEKGRCIKGF
jgi:hypothetical protein